MSWNDFQLAVWDAIDLILLACLNCFGVGQVEISVELKKDPVHFFLPQKRPLTWLGQFIFFGEQFDEISPQIRKRIYNETQYRIFEPLMNQHHGWMSANANGRPPNNWKPWIGKG